MLTIKSKKSTYILTLCLSVTSLNAMGASDEAIENLSDRMAYMGSSVEDVAIEMLTADEDAKERELLFAGLELDKDDEEFLEEFSLEKLRYLRKAFDLVPSMTPLHKSSYLNGFALYQGTDWNKNVTRLLNNGFKDRVQDLCTILEWAGGGLDVFVEQTFAITASLSIDRKVAIMTALSSRFSELKNAEYVEELRTKFNETSCSDDVRVVIKEARQKCGLYKG